MPAGSTYTPIATTTLGSAAATVTFSSISSAYTDLIIIANGKSDGVNADFGFRFNSDSGTNYSRTYVYGNGSSALSGRTTNSNYTNVWNFSNVDNLTNIAHIMNYANSTTYKTVLTRNADAASLGTVAQVGLWRSTSAITSILIMSGSSALLQSGSTFTLYGIASA